MREKAWRINKRLKIFLPTRLEEIGKEWKTKVPFRRAPNSKYVKIQAAGEGRGQLRRNSQAGEKTTQVHP